MANLQCVAVTSLESKCRNIVIPRVSISSFCYPSVEITEMTRRLPRVVHEDPTDVRTEVGRKEMAEADATAEMGGDGVGKTSALCGLDLKDYSLMAVLGCWRETVETLDRSARYRPAKYSN